MTAKLAPASTDAVVATPSGDNVVLRAPKISMIGGASLAKDVKLGSDTIQVGFIQNLVSSERVGVYRRNGDPKGEILREDRRNTPSALDIATPGSEPFYTTPETLSDSKKSVYPISEDNPGAPFKAAIDAGKLTETRGGDHFVTSLAAKGTGAPVHLKKMAWDVPWNLSLDAGFHGKGANEGIQNAGTAAPGILGGASANVLGNSPDNEIVAFVSDSAADQALRADKITFLNELAKHKRMAPDSYGKMVGALWRSPMAFVVHVVVNKTDATFGSDEITVTATAHNAVSRRLKLNDGQGADATLLAHMVYDPSKLDTATTVTIDVNGQTTTLPFPYLSKNWSMSSGKSGNYSIAAQLK